MSKAVRNKAGVVRIDQLRQHRVMGPKEEILRCKADLAQVDGEILRLARENGSHYPAMSFSDTVQKAIADHPGLGRRKRALEDFITCAMFETGMRTGGAAA
jgi:hypothetical protein